MMEDLVIALIYMSGIFGFLGLAGFLYMLTEKIPALDHLMNRFLQYIDITGRDDWDDDYYDEDEEDGYED